MEFFDPNQLPDTAADEVNKNSPEKARLQAEVEAIQQKLAQIFVPAERANLQLKMAQNLVDLEQGAEAWPAAKEAFNYFLSAEDWEQAAITCATLYLADQPDSLAALGQGIWLAVTYPIDPEVTVELLHYLIEDTPDDADGAAIAAATAAFVVDLRAQGQQREDLSFFTQQMLGKVAQRHSQVQNQAQFDYWIEKLELDQPDKFLVRLRNIIDVLVQDQWWFDREALQAALPED